MSEFSLIPAIGISATGLSAEARRMEVIANNVANANTSVGPDGKVFRRQEVIFAARLAERMKDNEKVGAGVELQEIIEDQRPPKRIYRPGHPDADAEGYVEMPDINVMEEMVDMISASRSYEANLSAIKTARNMAGQALEIMK
ncbi:MAG: flagellar basal body rod protein FlgC [Spartobacteria bacterium]|nr:flagellar basal body rod protein FlgC [Spartobacteria bacterium]